MKEKIKVKIKKAHKEIITVMTLANDGWYEDGEYAVSPNKKTCLTSPWLADFICEAPRYEFEILTD